VGWHVEGRATDALESLIARGDTDGNGVVELPSNGAMQRLYVRATSNVTMPDVRIPALVAPGSDVDIVPVDDVRTGLIFVKLTTSGSEQGGCEARLWSTRSREGVRMLLMAVSKVPAEHLFRLDALLPGSYVIEYGAPGAQWQRVGPFIVAGGQELDAGTYTLESPAKLKVGDDEAASKSIVTARTRVQGLWLEGQAETVHASAAMSLMPGEWTLSVAPVDKTSTKPSFGPRLVKAESGRTLTLDAGGAH
jgi:hypothetical protein